MKTLTLIGIFALLTGCAAHDRREDRREDRRSELQTTQKIAQGFALPAALKQA